MSSDGRRPLDWPQYVIGVGVGDMGHCPVPLVCDITIWYYSDLNSKYRIHVWSGCIYIYIYIYIYIWYIYKKARLSAAYVSIAPVPTPWPTVWHITLLQWRHGVSNHRQLDCLFFVHSLFRLISNNTSKIRIVGPLWGIHRLNSPINGQ